MRLRTLIFLTVFGLAILPLLPLVAFNLPGHIAKHEQDARQANLARAEIRYTELSEEIKQLQQSLRRLASLPTTREAAAGRAKSKAELVSLLSVWFEEDQKVRSVRVIDREGTEILGLSRAPGESLRPHALSGSVLPASWPTPAARSPGPLLNGENVYFYAFISVGRKLATAILQVDLPAMLQDYAGAYWITPDGRFLHQGPALRGRAAATGVQGGTIFEDFPGLQTAMSRSENNPFIWDRQGDRHLAWLPVMAGAEQPLLWIGQPVRRAVEGWKKSLVFSIIWITLIMMVMVFFIANRMAADVERIKEDMLTGLDRILNEEKDVHFQWRGPEELKTLAQELNALSRRYSVTSEARRQAEAALRESEDKFRNLTTSAHDAIILMDHQGNISYWNEAATAIFGYTDKEALGRPIHGLIDPRRADTGGDIDYFKGEPSLQETLELITSKKDGTPVPIELSLSAGRIQDQWHAIWIVRDISERKQAEAEARRQQQRLIQADKMISLGLLVSGVAHEINNPNSIAMLNTPMLYRSWESVSPILEEYYRSHGDFLVAGLEYSEMRDQVPRLFAELEESAKRIKQIVKDLKDYARQDTTRHMGSVDLNEIAKAAVRLTYNKLKKSTRRFVTHYEPNLPGIKGNRHRLEQVIINLIHNACEALPDNRAGITLSTAYHPAQQTVEIRVQDEGVGIPREVLGQITDPFFTTKRNLGGTGLGLSVSAGIVKEHNGVMQFDSVPGRGTMVVLTFPAFSSEKRDENS